MNFNKIFVIGLPRTGTTSLTKALEALGYKTLHNSRKFKVEQFNGVFCFSENDWGALTNFGENIYPQLDKQYPNSKFILTLRDKDKWLESIGWKLAEACENGFGKLARVDIFGSYVFNKERFSYVYDLHYKNVLDYFKNRPEDLLIMHLDKGDGWKKLCSFLGKEIPDTPFPHTHTRKEMEQERKNKKRNTLLQKIKYQVSYKTKKVLRLCKILK